MHKLSYLLSIIVLLAIHQLQAQTVHVNATTGNDAASGKVETPVATLQRAVELAKTFKPGESVTIKVAPGLYTLRDQVVIDKRNTDEAWLTIEAAAMPDDADWKPAQMPVIQSVSANNNKTQFQHAVGFLVAADHVRIRGLKFLGNGNPEVQYYYPVSRKDSTLTGLDISQCYFIGERNSAPIQGSIWAHGSGIHVDHCIFYGTKNALLLFMAIRDFSLKNSVIVGAYESAVWFGTFHEPFVFENNIVANSEYLWLRADKTLPKYHFKNCLFTDLKHEMGHYGQNGAVPAEQNAHSEERVARSGKLLLSEVATNGLPRDYLNPLPNSAGKELNAGIFKK
ncbi:hypothetical protein SAMN05216327_121109 [Dyadobacter sp. SG02]|uniref:hypothetical protein n=1 Tax=Dyadobacter sp. SG02 TaxID=1855291 RepID=UPI0008D1A03D|nr:hypothetical protein [Dyadobacter sp. SG02]SEJ81840.1 hypothetical protein SAMN05216327_121109 [Dyadobacter sp. SG02]